MQIRCPHCQTAHQLATDAPLDDTLCPTCGSSFGLVGDEALAYLYHEGDYVDPKDAPRPDVILLDLNLPRMGGHEVLQRLKQDPRFKSVPIIVLTTSGRADDIRMAYEAGANAYLLKPVEFARFTEVMGQLVTFWFETVELPPEA